MGAHDRLQHRQAGKARVGAREHPDRGPLGVGGAERERGGWQPTRGVTARREGGIYAFVGGDFQPWLAPSE